MGLEEFAGKKKSEVKPLNQGKRYRVRKYFFKTLIVRIHLFIFLIVSVYS